MHILTLISLVLKQLNWKHYDESSCVFQIKGLPEALDTPYVWSNYHASYAPKGRKIIDAFNKGNAVFTFPKPPLKCPGAPQKIMYIAERLLTEVCSLYHKHVYV